MLLQLKKYYYLGQVKKHPESIKRERTFSPAGKANGSKHLTGGNAIPDKNIQFFFLSL